MELREHQSKAISQIQEEFKRGNKRVVLGASCSFGKTVISAYMIKECYDKGKSAMFVCDRLKLVDQTIKTFQQWGIPFGVMQGNNELEDFSQRIQIASVQTMSKRVNSMANNFDLIIVDECHVQYAGFMKYLSNCKKAFVVGLSATPMSKGLGDFYQSLIVPITPRELLDKNFLAPVRYFSGKSVNLKGLKSRRGLVTGGTDYHPDDVAKLYENDKVLTGHIVNNWIEHGEDKQTIAFCASIKHSKFLVEEFIRHGIKARHIDGYTKPLERKKIFDEHNKGKFKILSCSRLLNTGYDEPSVACLIDCFPTRSLITMVQRYGRVMRICKDKPYAIILDHAKNVSSHGMAEDVVPSSLHKLTEKFKEKKQAKKVAKKPNTCPKCTKIFSGVKCSCGFELSLTEKIEYTNEMLTEIDNKVNHKVSDYSEMQDWYSDLKTMEMTKGYKRGWAEITYKSKFGKYPPKNMKYSFSPVINRKVQNYVKSQLIKYSYNKKKSSQSLMQRFISNKI